MANRALFCPSCGAYLPESIERCECGQTVPTAGSDPADSSQTPITRQDGVPLTLSIAVPAGTALPIPVHVAAPSSAEQLPPETVSSPLATANAAFSAKRVPPLVIAAAGGVLVLAAAAFFYVQTYSFPRRIDRALAAGHIFSPPGEAAVDIYAAEKAKNPSSTAVREAATKIASKIEPMGDAAFRRWYADSDGVDWSETEKIYAFLHEARPDDRLTHVRHEYSLGTLRLLNQVHSEALNHFHQALQLDPSFTLAINGIAKIYLQDSSPLKNEALGVEFYRRASATDPNFTWAWKNLGEYYMRKDDWFAAEQCMLKALATSPNRPSILRSLGRIYYNMQRYEQALDYNRRFLAVATDPDAIAKANSAIDEINKKLSN